jgi:hypothetical protein
MNDARVFQDPRIRGYTCKLNMAELYANIVYIHTRK